MLEKRNVDRSRELYYIHILGRVAEWASYNYIQSADRYALCLYVDILGCL